MSKKKKRVDVSGESQSCFGSDAFARLEVGGNLPAGPSVVHREKAEEKQRKKRLIRLDVKREKSGRGGKTVSVVYGASKLPVHVQKDLLKDFKKRHATGGTIQGDCIEIQGDFVSQIVDSINELGYTAVKAGG